MSAPCPTDDAPPPGVRPASTGDPGSFAHHTLETRIPRIIEQTIQANAYPDAIRRALAALAHEIQHEPMRPLREDAPDAAEWHALFAPHAGRSWLDVPFYFAESFVYRRLLEAVRYFQPGPWQGRDPFRPIKEAEYRSLAPRAALALAYRNVPEDPAEQLQQLRHWLLVSLWGNRADLSNQFAQEARRKAEQSGNLESLSSGGLLLVDESAAVAHALTARLPGELLIVTDNAGTELLCDLALADWLLASGTAQAVRFHVKAQPFFVSDVTLPDVEVALAVLRGMGGEGAALAARLDRQRAAGRLLFADHPFYTLGHFFAAMPPDLCAVYAQATLAIFKGDLNYRRLIYDASWPPGATFPAAVAWASAPVLALRTVKSDALVGVDAATQARLDAAHPNWRVDGSVGTIQFAA
jgi:hypothetical protein